MKKAVIVNIIYVLIAVLFLYTGISKYQMFRSSYVSLKHALIVGPIGGFLAYTLPATEILIAIGLFIPKLERIAIISALILMSLFTLYSAYIVFMAVKIPCSCGGIMKDLTWRQHLIVNSIYTLLAYIALRMHNQIRKGPNNTNIQTTQNQLSQA